jgi:glycosyltransferase involved in cell wall biosynthesis
MHTEQAVDSGILFYPRGGSSLVVRYLMQHMGTLGWNTRVFSGSLGTSGSASHAGTFYAPTHVITSDYSNALHAHKTGKDALAEPVPFHPSYEDRPDVPDRVFAAVSPGIAAGLEDYWRRHFTEHHAGETGGLLHLHHLTPQHAAAHRLGRTVLTTLHGTELKFLAGALRRAKVAEACGLTAAEAARPLSAARRDSLVRTARSQGIAPQEAEALAAGSWSNWEHAPFWVRRLRAYARVSTRTVVISEQDRTLAQSLLGLAPDRLEIIPNGVDTERFSPRGAAHSDADREDLLRRWLVDTPQGWRPHAEPGSLRYTASDVHRMLWDPAGNRRPLMLWMGRFLTFKRLDVLLHALAALRTRTPVRPALLVLGGFPGEWEGEHPHTLAQRLGLGGDVYFAGWRRHEELVDALRCCDLLTAPSVDEPFGLIYLEAMASGVPVVATASGAPLHYVQPEGKSANGWLSAPGDPHSLTDVLAHALSDTAELARRGRNARNFTVAHYGWPTIARRYEAAYERALAR